MDKDDGSEGEHNEKSDERKRHVGWGLQQKKIEGNDVPQGGKAAEIAVVGAHARVAEVDRAGDHDHSRGGKREEFRQDRPERQRRGRHQHVVQVVDDEINGRTGPARRDFAHLEGASKRPVDRVDEKCQPQPQEHIGPFAGVDRAQREQGEDRAEGSQAVDAEGGRTTDKRNGMGVVRGHSHCS